MNCHSEIKKKPFSVQCSTTSGRICEFNPKHWHFLYLVWFRVDLDFTFLQKMASEQPNSLCDRCCKHSSHFLTLKCPPHIYALEAVQDYVRSCRSECHYCSAERKHETRWNSTKAKCTVLIRERVMYHCVWSMASSFLEALKKFLTDYIFMYRSQLSQMRTFIMQKSWFRRRGELRCMILHPKREECFFTKMIYKKRHGKLWQKINTLHDNAHLHVEDLTLMTLEILGTEIKNHSPYSLNCLHSNLIHIQIK